MPGIEPVQTLLSTSMEAISVLVADFQAGEYRRHGESVAPSEVLESVSASAFTSSGIRATAGFKNLLPNLPLAGGAPGGLRVGGGSLPTGWSEHYAAIPKTVVSSDQSGFQLAFGAPQGREFGGVRLPALTLNGRAHVGLDLEVSAVDHNHQVDLYLGWYNVSTGQFTSNGGVPSLITSREPKQRLTAVVEAPTGRHSLVVYLVARDTASTAARPMLFVGGPTIVAASTASVQVSTAGAVVGPLSAGGQLPSGWQEHLGATKKTVSAVGASQFEVQFDTRSGTNLGGVRTAAIDPRGCDVRFEMSVELAGVAGSAQIGVALAWFNSSSVLLPAAGSVTLTEAQPRRRVSVMLGDPGQVARVAIYAYWKTSPTSELPRIAFGDFACTLVPKVSADPYEQAPFGVGTVSFKSARLKCPTGDFVVVADAVGVGTITKPVSVQGPAESAGFDLASTLGGHFTLSRLFLVERAAFDVAVLDQQSPPQWISARHLTGHSKGAVALGLRRLISARSDAAPGASADYSVLVAKNRPGRTRFEVKTGDRAEGDGPTQERAELFNRIPYPYDVDLWTRDDFRVASFPSSDPDHYCLINQWRYTNDPGDLSALSPDLAVVLYPLSQERLQLRLVTRSDPNPASTQTPPYSLDANSTAAVASVERLRVDIAASSWHSLVYQSRFRREGLGYLRVWLDRQLVFDRAIPLGYNRIEGPQFRYGVYRRATVGVTVVEHANTRWGTGNLSDSVGHPFAL